MWFAKIMVRFFMSIDATLFNFISTLYDLLIAISRTSILSQGDIAQFAYRIELLLGIFMLFKLSFSLITYIVNPDDFTDKSKGFGKLIQNAVISLAMLVLVPYAFQMAFNLQAKILDDNLLAKFLLGEKITESDGSLDDLTIIDTAGGEMAFQVMLPFFLPRSSINALNNCTNIYGDDGYFNADCASDLSSAGASSQTVTNYTKGIENKSLGLTFRSDMALQTTKDGDNEYFIIDYKYPLATVVAVVVCLLLITFCIDVGVRSVKLAFLQLVYTIPVISYMDPKSGKEGIFKKWYQMCFSTFLSLFIRLVALYFGIYVISKVGDFGMYDVVNGSEITNGWVKLFVIIGVLMFVKQLPKILENLGFKLDGGFTMNPLKKLEDGMIGGKQIFNVGKRAGKVAAFSAGAGAAAFGSNLLTAGSRIRNAQGIRGKLRAGLNTFTGGLSAMKNGVKSGISNEKLGKGFSNSYSSAMKQMRREQARADDGVGKMSVRKAKMQKAMGLQTKGERAKQTSENMKKIQEKYDAMKSAAAGADEQVKGWTKQLETMKRSAPTADKFTDAAGNFDDVAYGNAVTAYNLGVKKIEDKIDERVKLIARGDAQVQRTEDGHIVVDDAATTAITSLAAQMESITNKTNRTGHRIDRDYADDTITTYDADDKRDVVGNYKSSKGASTQFNASDKVQHHLDVDSYASSDNK